MANESSVSNATNYQEIGEFWDTHDATDCGDHESVEFDVHIRSQRHYFAVDGQLCTKIRELADQRGISEETLLNMFLQEHIDNSKVTKELNTTFQRTTAIPLPTSSRLPRSSLSFVSRRHRDTEKRL